MIRGLLTISVLLALSWPAEAAQKRSPQVRAEFVRKHPCPAVDPVTGHCAYQADHKDPICAGGADAVHNLQWLSVDAHKRKTRHDVAFCAVLRRTRIPANDNAP